MSVRRPSADAVDVGGLLGEQRGVVEGGADGDHELELARDGGERGGGGHGVERVGFDAFDVVEVELGDESEVVAEGFGARAEVAHVVEGGGHVFVVDVAEPSAEDGEPEAVAHRDKGNCGRVLQLSTLFSFFVR